MNIDDQNFEEPDLSRIWIEDGAKELEGLLYALLMLLMLLLIAKWKRKHEEEMHKMKMRSIL